MTSSSASPQALIVWTRSCWPRSSRVSSSRPAAPITPFIGVRISWLMVARNIDLARTADSASSALAASVPLRYSTAARERRRSIICRHITTTTTIISSVRAATAIASIQCRPSAHSRASTVSRLLRLLASSTSRPVSGRRLRSSARSQPRSASVKKPRASAASKAGVIASIRKTASADRRWNASSASKAAGSLPDFSRPSRL
ncbi:hypothetical protein A6302_04370 [Methylobrevis pamukkalensis]|uniref:Uncharacterized protein n=1 Tax=Methylobrevis pamukkalensis TaxID=1439726 RepID=A0A1E3GUR2_9HYPH|nr:hypothetical protein A6302_04370 [Methylobrevis pamukkalensis]